jgi:SAM-dependent methyltransferase
MDIDDYGLGELRDLADATVLVAAASEAGMFQALGSGPASAKELAEKLDFDERATRIVLHALEATGLLERVEGRFAPTPRCARELCDPAADGFLGRGLPHWLHALRARTRIGEVLRRGGPLRRRDVPRSPKHVARFTAAMAAAPSERLERIVSLCLERRPDASSILDLGGGSGNLTRAFVARGLSGTLFDTPDIVAHVVEAYGLDDVQGLDVVAGDFTRDELPEGPFDLVVLSNVIHIYPPAVVQDLFEKAADVMAPGSVLAVVESLRGRSPRAADVGLHMLLKSDAGDAYSGEQIETWTRASFEDCRVVDVDELRQLVTAVRSSPRR